MKTISPTYFVESESGEKINLTPLLVVVTNCPRCGVEHEIHWFDLVRIIQSGGDTCETMIYCCFCVPKVIAAEDEAMQSAEGS